MKKCLLLIGLVFILGSFQNAPPKSKQILRDMLKSISTIKTMTYTLKGWERLKGGKIQYSEIDAKQNINPFKLYLHSKAEPNKGVQIIYNEEHYGKKGYVNAGRFIPNIKLDPYGGRMREKQHHTILNTGFNTLAGIIKNALARAEKEGEPGDLEKFCTYDGDLTWDGKPCYKVTISDPTYNYINYTVKEDDDVEKLEVTKYICGYLIIEKNNNVKDFWSLKPGMQIKIPSSYAKKTVLYIEKKTNLPIYQSMNDEIGEFERYEFYNLEVNIPINEDNFKNFP